MNSPDGVNHTQTDQNNLGHFGDTNLKLKCFGQHSKWLKRIMSVFVVSL